MISPLFGARPSESQRTQRSNSSQAHAAQQQEQALQRQAQSASAIPSAQNEAIIPSILATIQQRMQRLHTENQSSPPANVRFGQRE